MSDYYRRYYEPRFTCDCDTALEHEIRCIRGSQSQTKQSKPQPKKKEKVMSKKFYQVKKDTHLWHAGAILKKEDDEYRPVSDIWNVVEDSEPFEHASIVEAEENAEWFERVYESNVFGKAKYVTKEKARELASKFFNSEDQDEEDR